MTAVSSEWRRFLTRQVPFPSAASTSARFEILLLPGVAMVMGDLVGVADLTVTASHRTRRMTSSATTDAFSSYVLPILESRTIFLAGTSVLLVDLHDVQQTVDRELLRGGKAVMRLSDSETGRLYACKARVRRPTATWLSTPIERATSASRMIPTETHSPCSIAGVSTASIACPMVCPKLTRFRRPVSRSSIVTMCALT